MRLELLLKPQILLALFITAVGAVFTSRMLIKKNNTAPVPYTVALPTRRDIIQHISASGTLKAKDQISIGSLISGRVEKIFVDDNDSVKKGQVLAVLNNGIGKNGVDLAQAQLDQAQAQLEYQKRFFARQQTLYEAGELADNQFDQITQQYKLAQAKVDEARATVAIETQKYKDLSIISPENGVVIAKRIDIGQMITSQLDAKVLFEIAKDLKEMEVYADIDEADVGLVKEGQEAHFTVDTFPNRTFSSTVRLVEYLSKIVDSSVTYAAVLNVANPNLELRPGMTANVDIKVASRTGALCVPYSALRINGAQLEAYAKSKKMACTRLGKTGHKAKRLDNLWVFENNSFKQIHVTFGARDGSFVEVLEGLTDRQQVITRFVLVSDNSSALKSMLGGGLGGNK
jgi:HlyD family secretion protein